MLIYSGLWKKHCLVSAAGCMFYCIVVCWIESIREGTAYHVKLTAHWPFRGYFCTVCFSLNYLAWNIVSLPLCQWCLQVYALCVPWELRPEICLANISAVSTAVLNSSIRAPSVPEDVFQRKSMNKCSEVKGAFPAQGVGSNGHCVRRLSIGTQFIHGVHF